MGLTGSALNRFRDRIDETLRDAFPCRLSINGHLVTASGPGGRAVSEYEDGGQDHTYRFPFRVPLSALQSPLAIGQSVDWIISDIKTLHLEIMELPERPHESVAAFTCKKRRE
jgi:hypothetical protein